MIPVSVEVGKRLNGATKLNKRIKSHINTASHIDIDELGGMDAWYDLNFES